MNGENLEIIVFRRPNMFYVNHNMFNQAGVGELEKLFTIENYECSPQALQLFYPERFLNVVEQRALLTRIKNAKNYTKISITTSSPFIIQTAHKDVIKIYSPENENLSEDVFKLSSDYSGMPDDSKLSFF